MRKLQIFLESSEYQAELYNTSQQEISPYSIGKIVSSPLFDENNSNLSQNFLQKGIEKEIARTKLQVYRTKRNKFLC